MNQTQAGRLLTLAWFLRTQVKPKEFDMSSFATKSECGSTACALGECTVIWPNKFSLFRVSAASDFFDLVIDGECQDGVVTGDAVLSFFGVTYSEARQLFAASYGQRTPKQEAAIIETIVRDHGYVYAN